MCDRAAVWLSVTLAAVEVSATSPPVEGEIGWELTRSYVWRGQVINDEPCIQPHAEIRWRDVWMRIAATWDVHHRPESAARTRTDLSAGSGWVAPDGGHLFTLGVIARVYAGTSRNHPRNTSELAARYTHIRSFQADRWGSASVTVYYDFVEIQGTYAQTELVYYLPLVRDTMALETYVSLGWGDAPWVKAGFSLPRFVVPSERTYTPDHAACLDALLQVRCPIAVTDRLSVIPSLRYLYLVDHRLRNALEDAGLAPDNLGGSLAMTYRF